MTILFDRIIVNTMNLIAFKNFFSKGHERSVKAKKNVMISFGFKGASVIIGFVFVPLILNYIDQERYGIWLTISSIIAWTSFFDIGLGNGLRNRFAEAIACNDKILARTYVSTTYVVLGLILSVLLLLGLVLIPMIEWQKVLNTKNIGSSELAIIISIVFSFFILQLFFKQIGALLLANQRPAINSSFGPISKLLSLIIILFLIYTAKSSLLYLAISLSITPVVVYLAVSIYFFKKEYKEYVPSIKYLNFKKVKDLFGLGLKFFIIQVAGLIFYTTDNIIITQLFGPLEVTPYQISHKYFNVILIGFFVLLSPLWSAVTEAYVKNDIDWIKRSIRKLTMIWIVLIFFVFLLLAFSNIVYNIWLGNNKVSISFFMSLTWAGFVILQSFNSIFVNFINGVGKIKLQLIIAVFSMILNIPLSIFFAKNLSLGVPGVLLGTIVTTVISIIFSLIQYKKIINGNALGIWNK